MTPPSPTLFKKKAKRTQLTFNYGTDATLTVAGLCVLVVIDTRLSAAAERGQRSSALSQRRVGVGSEAAERRASLSLCRILIRRCTFTYEYDSIVREPNGETSSHATCHGRLGHSRLSSLSHC